MPDFRYADRVVQFWQPSLPVIPKDVISFGSGEAYPDGLPDMVEAAREAVTAYRTETMQYSPREGLPELRQWVAEYIQEEGVHVTPEHVLIVNGAKHGLDMICKVFLNPGDGVVVTSPTYMSALPIFRGYEAVFVEVAQDSDGLIVPDLEHRLRELERAGRPAPKLIYNVPEFHNPTGLTMSNQRRVELVNLAERRELLIVEDDPYRRVRFEGLPIPPIQSFDRVGCVISLGTFAKIVAPGLRIGWVVASPDIVKKMAVLKSDGGSCPLTQRMILEYWKQGSLEPHIKELAVIYAGNRDVMIEALYRNLPGATVVKPQGGYYLWVRLPEGVQSDRLLVVALRHGVEYLPADQFYASRGPANYLRLAYSYNSPESIREGMRRLGAAFKELASLKELPAR